MCLWFNILVPFKMYIFPELPEKRGLLFSDDDDKLEVDAHITSGLVAAAKITLFEVKILPGLGSIQPLDLCVTGTPNVRTLLHFEGGGNTRRQRTSLGGSNEGETYHWVVWKPFQNGGRWCEWPSVLCAISRRHTIHQSSLWFQYLPSSDVHVNKNAKFDPSSKIFEVIHLCVFGSTCVGLFTAFWKCSCLYWLTLTD